MKNSLKLLIASIMIGTIVAGCASTKKPVDKVDKVDKVDNVSYIATMNDQKITEDEYKYFLMVTQSNIEQYSNVQDEASKKALWAGNFADKPAVQFAKESALEETKGFKLLLEKANSAGYKLKQEEIDSLNLEIDTYVKTLGEGEVGTKKYQEQYGITVDAVKTVNKNLMLVQNYYKDEVNKIQNTDEELKKQYEDNLLTYQQVTVKHVLFMTIDQTTGAALPQEKQDEVKKKAEGILAKVKAGEDIGALADQYTEDTGSKGKGGEYTFPKGQMVKEFEDWSFSAKVGDVGLVKTEYGYHVVRLEKIFSFDDVKETVKTDLSAKKFNDKVEAFKKEAKYELKMNASVYDKITVKQN